MKIESLKDSKIDFLDGIDRVIHEPSRLAILTVLYSLSFADFMFLSRATGFSKGNLSGHITKLEQESMIKVEKYFIGKIPHTRVTLTTEGRSRVNKYIAQLKKIINSF